MIKTKQALEDVGTTVDVLEELPPEITVGLPAEQIVSSYLSITFENAKPNNIELGHLTFKVEKEWLRQNSIHKWSVVLSHYDLEIGQWLSLPTKRVKEDDLHVYYTAIIPRFSIFAISGSQIIPPLKFKVTNLTISPATVEVGQELIITADITNISDIAGTYIAILWIEGTIEAAQDVFIEAGETKSVSLAVSQDVEGSYQVRVDRLSGSFSVTEVVEVPPPVAWWIWLIIALALAVISGLLLWSMLRSEKLSWLMKGRQ